MDKWLPNTQGTLCVAAILQPFQSAEEVCRVEAKPTSHAASLTQALRSFYRYRTVTRPKCRFGPGLVLSTRTALHIVS